MPGVIHRKQERRDKTTNFLLSFGSVKSKVADAVDSYRNISSVQDIKETDAQWLKQIIQKEFQQMRIIYRN